MSMRPGSNGAALPDTGARARLLAAKLRALVRAGWAGRGGDGDDQVADQVAGLVADPLPLGAALREAGGGRGWVLVDAEGAGAGAGGEDGGAALGGALAWALSRSVRELNLLVEGPAGALARRAALFAEPIEVWRVDGARVEAAPPAPIEPEPALAPAVAAAAGGLQAAGLTPVAEHGTLHGEVLGLEVARVEPDGAGGARRRVGVGRYERELYEVQHGGAPPDEALADAVAHVRALRRPGAAPHPANQLAPERWLRAVLIAEPGLVGADRLEPVAPPAARAGVRERGPAFALGAGPDGTMLVACSTGVDLGLVPAAADARLALAEGRSGAGHAPPAGPIRLVLAVPEGDDHAVTRRLAAALREPAAVVTIPRDWRRRGA